LVHFGSRGNTIDCEVNQLSRSDNVHYLVNVDEYVFALLLKILRNSNVFVLRVDAGMNKAVHVDVEVVDLGIARHGRVGIWFTGVFEHFRIPHAHPFEEDGDTHLGVLISNDYYHALETI